MQMIPESPAANTEAPVTSVHRMARMLNTGRPASDAEALRMLRAAFPQSSLQERTAALARHSAGTLVPIS